MRRGSTSLIAATLLALPAPGAAPLCAQDAPPSVQVGGNGRLAYTPNERGDVVPDFSHCGYMGNAAPIPLLEVKLEVSPDNDGRDDTARIQDVIDKVGAMPMNEHGHRGAVLLRRGAYTLEGTLRVKHDGVVLRGEGDGDDGTVLHATGRQKTLIVVGNNARPRGSGGSVAITDGYVPVGATQFNVKAPGALSVGDRVLVRRHANRQWISVIGMDRIPPRSDGGPRYQWSPFTLEFDRVITAIDGSLVTLDAPIGNAIQQEFGGGDVVRYREPNRVRHAGVEGLRGVSRFDPAKRAGGRFVDEEHCWSMVSISGAVNAWARNITGRYFAGSVVHVGEGARHVTVRDAQSLEMVAEVTGGRMYPFTIGGGQLVLVLNCRAHDARHAFALGARVAGPNAFVACTGHRAPNGPAGESGPHHRWSVAALFDNVVLERGSLAAYDRGAMGTGQGWSGAQMVFWNCRAPLMVIDSPPTATNWSIGCTATKRQGRGVWESNDRQVLPRSLFMKQLTDRLGYGALQHVRF